MTAKSKVSHDKPADNAEADVLPAGVPDAQVKEAKAEVKEMQDEPAVLPVDETIIEELPENGVVLGTVMSSEAAAEEAGAPTAAGPGGAFVDEFVGQGGTFIVDGKTGQRKRAHTEVTDEKGKPVGFRPIP